MIKRKLNGWQVFNGPPSDELKKAMDKAARNVGNYSDGRDTPFKSIVLWQEDDPGLDQIMGTPSTVCPFCNIEAYEAELDEYGGICGECYNDGV